MGGKVRGFMKAKTVFENLKKIFGAFAIVLSFWAALFTAFFIANSIVILVHSDGYHEVVYSVDQLLFRKGEMGSNSRSSDEYYAMGTVEGEQERFSLGEYLQGVIRTREDMESQVHVGQKLKVLYNPDVPQKTNMRILYTKKNFKQNWKRRQKKMINTGYGPWFLCVLLCLVFGFAAGQIKSAVKITIGSCVFIVFAWIPGILNYFF